jgi:hypothetical protein
MIVKDGACESVLAHSVKSLVFDAQITAMLTENVSRREENALFDRELCNNMAPSSFSVTGFFFTNCAAQIADRRL